jgi:hypothetical protein
VGPADQLVLQNDFDSRTSLIDVVTCFVSLLLTMDIKALCFYIGVPAWKCGFNMGGGIMNKINNVPVKVGKR